MKKMLLVHKFEHSPTATTFYKIKLIPVHSGVIPVHSTSFWFIAVHSGSFRFIPVHSGSFRSIPVHSGSFRSIPVHSTSFRSVSVFSNARIALNTFTLHTIEYKKQVGKSSPETVQRYAHDHAGNKHDKMSNLIVFDKTFF